VKRIVVAKYNEDIGWTNNPVIAQRGWEVEIIEKNRPAGNVGREAESYLFYIVENYKNIRYEDLIFFCQGNPFPHTESFYEALLLDRQTFLGAVYVCDQTGEPHGHDLPVAEYYQTIFKEECPAAIYFYAGAQFIIDGANILARPLEFWQKLYDMSLQDKAPWVFERLWQFIFWF